MVRKNCSLAHRLCEIDPCHDQKNSYAYYQPLKVLYETSYWPNDLLSHKSGTNFKSRSMLLNVVNIFLSVHNLKLLCCMVRHILKEKAYT